MIVTTGGRTNQACIQEAIQIAKDLDSPYEERKKRSVKDMHMTFNDDCLVVGRERLELYRRGSSVPFFFHPNAAMLRLKRLINGVTDPFIEAAGLGPGMSLLDCTLGLGSDSIVAGYVTGEKGTVTGIEENAFLAYLVKRGLSLWESGFGEFDSAMRRISVINSNSLEYLKTLKDQSVDVIYFDPMFEETIAESDGIRGLAGFALFRPLTLESIEEAKRIASKKIVLKDHYKSSRFQDLGFEVHKRKTSKFHFGVIRLD
ncbi:class I SAM-dependent methyltransferase [Peribacillus kribbensis]|uniref:class I SAM-dependent methyltransferase n=1 Tax=Peribacillus kribbensis TaxID=356658 RepID=UPI00047A8329|nr:class I SAM-dependent methyltransferase [Peribacillus kribbensis]